MKCINMFLDAIAVGGSYEWAIGPPRDSATVVLETRLHKKDEG